MGDLLAFIIAPQPTLALSSSAWGLAAADKTCGLFYRVNTDGTVGQLPQTVSPTSLSGFNFAVDANGAICMADANGAVICKPPSGAATTQSWNGLFARALRYGWDGALHINSADNVYRIQGNTPTALIPLATVSGTLTVNASAASSVQREDYTYDPADRLASVMRDGHPAEQFGYDPVGSRAIDRQAQDYVYDAMNRLTQGNGASYTYDANGNRLSKTDANGVTRYTWDGENRLVRIDFPDGRKADYAYDPLHRRIANKLEGVKSCYMTFLFNRFLKNSQGVTVSVFL